MSDAPVVPAPAPELPRRGLLRGRGGAWGEVGTQVLAFLLSLGVLIGILTALHYDPAQILWALWNGSVGSRPSLGVSASEATPIILAAVAVWLAAQTGLFNIGADGQLQMGGLAAVVTTLYAGLPSTSWVLIPLGLLAATVAGLLWAGIVAVIKVYRGANEIISTLMLNFIAAITISQLIRGVLQDAANPYTPQSKPVPSGAKINALLSGTQLTWGIILAVVLAFGTIAFVKNTTVGLRLRAIGLNREAARYSGIAIERYWLSSMLISGAICGLAGGLVLLGLRYYIAPGWASPWGYTGILIAFLAARSPYLIPLWGVLFGMLASAGPVLKGEASVPDSIVTIMQTLPVIVLFLLYVVARRSGGLLAPFGRPKSTPPVEPPTGETAEIGPPGAVGA